ncbi:hypothetical protein HDU98_001116, partial [Podochytrium sp. JEL0797]
MSIAAKEKEVFEVVSDPLLDVLPSLGAGEEEAHSAESSAPEQQQQHQQLAPNAEHSSAILSEEAVSHGEDDHDEGVTHSTDEFLSSVLGQPLQFDATEPYDPYHPSPEHPEKSMMMMEGAEEEGHEKVDLYDSYSHQKNAFDASPPVRPPPPPPPTSSQHYERTTPERSANDGYRQQQHQQHQQRSSNYSAYNKGNTTPPQRDQRDYSASRARDDAPRNRDDTTRSRDDASRTRDDARSDSRGDTRGDSRSDSRNIRDARDTVDNRRDSTRGDNTNRDTRRKRDDDHDAFSAKRAKTNDDAVSEKRAASSRPASAPKRNERDEALLAVARLCDSPEKLDKALDYAKQLVADAADKRLSLNDQIAAIRKVMLAACRARRVRIAQQAYELMIDLRASYEPSASDLLDLLSMYVATGKAELMADMVATCKPSLTVSNVAVLWQTALVAPTKGRSILIALTKLLLGSMDKTPPSNEFFGIVVLELIAANLSDWLDKVLMKLNVGNVPSRSNYQAHMAPRTSIPLKRGILIAVIEFYITTRNAVSAFECLKYMYDVGFAFHEESLFGVFQLALSGNDIDMITEIFKMIKSVSGVFLSDPLLFDKVLTVAASNDKINTAIDIIEHMAQTKTRPSLWSSILSVMRLASSLDLLQKFVGVFNVFFTAEGDSSATPHSDMDPLLISELVTNCVAHGMYTHAFWYFKYMSHAGIPRTPEAYRSLVFALDQDPRGLKTESMALWTDMNSNQYPVSSEQTQVLFKALLAHGGLDAKKAALEMYDACAGSVGARQRLVRNVNPNALLDFIFYFDRDNEGFALFEELCAADPLWPATLTDNVSILLFQKGGDQGRFDVLQLVVDRLRASGQTVPNRQLVRNLIGCLASVRSSDPQRILLATQIYVWGVKAGTSGYIKTKELSNLNLRLEECWCLLDIRLHLLRCLEWMHREVPKNQINADLKVWLPPVCSVLNSNPSGNSIVKLKGPVLANCVKHEIKGWFDGRMDVRVETDERDRDGGKSILVITKQSVLEWMAYNFGAGFEHDSVFNCVVEIRDKMFEGGSLLFSKENQKSDYRRNDRNSNHSRNDGPSPPYTSRGSNNNTSNARQPYKRDDRRDDRRDDSVQRRDEPNRTRDDTTRRDNSLMRRNDAASSSSRRDEYGSGSRYEGGSNAGSSSSVARDRSGGDDSYGRSNDAHYRSGGGDDSYSSSGRDRGDDSYNDASLLLPPVVTTSSAYDDSNAAYDYASLAPPRSATSVREEYGSNA